MSKQRLADSYRSIDILTSDRKQIVVTMYSEAIQSLKRALETEPNSARNRHVQRTFAIVQELNSSLDYAAGGDLATRLSAVYRWVSSSLMRGQMLGDKRLLQDVLTVMERLFEVWKEAVASVEER